MDPERAALASAWRPMAVDAVRAVIENTSARVWLSGGYALDLWLGYPSRGHGDIDVSVLSEDWRALARSLPPWLALFAAENGRLRSVTASEQEPPMNTWCQDIRTGEMVLQINAESGTIDEWIYRREPAIALPWLDAVVEIDGLPTVAPEVQLLWKSKSPGAKDEIDWNSVIPRLGSPARRWLYASISVAHPESPWAMRLR